MHMRHHAWWLGWLAVLKGKTPWMPVKRAIAVLVERPRFDRSLDPGEPQLSPTAAHIVRKCIWNERDALRRMPEPQGQSCGALVWFHEHLTEELQ